MRIYSVADLHGRKEYLSRLHERARSSAPDVIVIAGDIIGNADPARLLVSLDALNIPVIAVRGNADPRDLEKIAGSYQNIWLLEGNRVNLKGISFVGIGGAVVWPFRSKIAWRERMATENLLHLVTADSVLVAHPPPRGAHDLVLGFFHSGSQGVAEIIDRCQPMLCLCGHIHERPGFSRMGKTTVVNASMGKRGAGALIDIGESGRVDVTMLS